MKPRISVKAFDKLRRKIAREYRSQVKSPEGGGWRAVGARFGISPAMANLIAVQGYEPRDALIRKTLGLPVLGQGRVCALHGVVHDRQCRATSEVTAAPRTNWRALSLLLAGIVVNQREWGWPW